MRHALRAVLVGLVSLSPLVTATSARAAVFTYTSSAAWEAAVSDFNVWDFNGPEGNLVITLNSLGTDIVSVSSVGGDAAGIIHDSALCGNSGGAVDCFLPVQFDILEPRNAFAFDNLDFTEFEEAVVEVFFEGGGAPFTAVFDLAGAPPLTPVFFGLISDVNLARVSVYSRDPGSQAIGERANVIDNVRVGVAEVVPEPGTLALLGLGLGTVLVKRRRR